jgi:hypothetical protein
MKIDDINILFIFKKLEPVFNTNFDCRDLNN